MTPSFIFYRIIGVYPAALKFSAEFKFNIKTNKRWLLPVLHKRKCK